MSNRRHDPRPNQLPDELHRRAKRFAAEREISLAEITHRGIERFLGRFPDSRPAKKGWQLPRIDGGGRRVPPGRLREIAGEAKKNFARRRACDSRAALAWSGQGLTGFVTVNVKSFEGLGLAKVWSPLKSQVVRLIIRIGNGS